MKKKALLEVINRKSLGKKEEPQLIPLLVKRVTNGWNPKTLTLASLKGRISVSVKVPEGSQWHAQTEQFACPDPLIGAN